MYTIQKIEQQILQTVKTAVGKKYTPTANELAAPPDTKWGDIAYPCFGLAKGFGKPPAEIAAELAPKIEPKGLIVKVEARGPYINFFIDPKILACDTLKEIETTGDKYGSWTTGRGKRIMVEYAQPNTHKAIHVGHLRNFFLGKAIVNLLVALGYEVVATSYHGDVGTHVATALWGFLKFHKNGEPSVRGRGEWLGKIYAEAATYLENHPEMRAEVAEINQKLAAHDRELMKLWKRTREWSIAELRSIFRELNLEFARNYFESEMEERGRKIVAELIQKGIAHQSQGAIVIPLEKYGLDTLLILKSDGTTVYATRDFALAEDKFKRWKLDRSIVVVDIRQALYFKQLFKALELAGFKKPMAHVPYEFVTLKEGAISSRKGTIVTYGQFRDEVVAVARRETKKRHEDWGERKIKKTVWQIAQAAMRVGMLSPDVTRAIIFDAQTATSFDGFTGPYLQYTGARIASILRKAEIKNIKRPRDQEIKTRSQEIQPVEKQLLLALARYPQVVLKTAGEMRPAPLCEYLFGLAKIFAEFYESQPVLKAEPAVREFRLRLVGGLQTVLEHGAKLLGIEIPNEM